MIANPWLLNVAAGACAIAAFALVVALVGFVDRSRPRCRRCRRDVRPFAWREPPVCDCGEDLARPAAVRARRRRPKALLVVAAVTCVAAVAVVALAFGRAREKGQWRDLVPSPIFARWLARDPSPENLESLVERLDRGMAADEASTYIEALASAKPMSLAEPLRAILVSASAAPLSEAAVAVALSDTSFGFDAQPEPEDGSRLRSLTVLANVAQGSPIRTFLKVDSVVVNGVGRPIRMRTHRGDELTSWALLTSSITIEIDVEGVASDPSTLQVEIHGEAAFATTVPPVNLGFVGPPGPVTIELDPAAFQAFRGPLRVAASPIAIVAPPAPTRPSLPLMRTVEHDVRGLTALFAGTCLGMIVGGGLAAAAILFALGAGRGWQGLARPTCRRCGFGFEATPGALPSACSECGIDPSRVGNAVFTRSKPSTLSRAVTVPVTAIGGLVLAVGFGVMAGRAATGRLVGAEGSGDRFLREVTAVFERHTDDVESLGSQLGRELQIAYEHFRREDVLTAIRLANEARDRAAEDGVAWPRDVADEAVLAGLLLRAQPLQLVDEPEVRALALDLSKGSQVSIPSRVAVGAPFTITVLGMSPVWPEVTVEGPGLANPLRSTTGRTQHPGFAAPGIYELAITVEPVITSLQRERTSLAPPITSVHRIEAVAPGIPVDQPTTDPARDPFAHDSLAIDVWLYERLGERMVTVIVRAFPEAALMGDWELAIGDARLRLPAEYVLPTTYFGPYPFPAGAPSDRATLRFLPKPWPNPPIVGERTEGPRWAAESTIDLPLTSRTRSFGGERFTYRFRRNAESVTSQPPAAP
ncbi:MAG: hypothetical protein JNM94_06755 [Phycisphaerae bacterium]|nr:hypothetical protein [Phycisphaerae bacterium]